MRYLKDYRWLVRFAAVAIVAAVVFVASAPIAAQESQRTVSAQAATAQSYTPSRTAWGGSRPTGLVGYARGSDPQVWRARISDG